MDEYPDAIAWRVPKQDPELAQRVPTQQDTTGQQSPLPYGRHDSNTGHYTLTFPSKNHAKSFLGLMANGNSPPDPDQVKQKIEAGLDVSLRFFGVAEGALHGLASLGGCYVEI